MINEMKFAQYVFGSKHCNVYPGEKFENLGRLVDKSSAILLIDANVYNLHRETFSDWKTIIIKPGEDSKQYSTVTDIIRQLIRYEADRTSWLIGIGGGVVTDITGFVASIYMRGVRFGFLPTTLLGIVDAAIGGKNGINVNLYKNLIGTINQPEFILVDHDFLKTLPQEEWINGMAEVIKHACIRDRAMFDLLEQHSLDAICGSDEGLLRDLIARNIDIKMSIVQKDEREAGERKLLNFGHTLGHAIEIFSKLPHGHAVGIGMALAADLSVKHAGLSEDEYSRIIDVLIKYKLPITTSLTMDEVFELIRLDKKRRGNVIDLVLLKSIGSAAIHTVELEELKTVLD
jgi:3-dehydroquinate synthase